jgi:sugar phosphate permease
VYYGWWVVAACFLIAFYTGGAVFYTFTAVFEPIAREFNWSYTQVSVAASLRGLELGILAPIVGTMVDRWGPRRIMLVSLFICALGLVLLSRTTSLAMYYGSFVLIAIGMSGGGSTVTMTTITNWFRKKAGLATGITICGYGASGLMIPVVVWLIDTYSWRWAMVALALGMLVICLPLSLLIRHKPEQYGLLPDGEEASTALSKVSLHTDSNEDSISARQALTSRTFWHISLGLMPYLIGVYAVSTHVMPYLSRIGIARSVSGLAAMGIPLMSIAGRFSFGWLGDKVNNKRLATWGLVMVGIGLAFFQLTSLVGTGLLLLFLLFFGVGYGGAVAMVAILVRRYFGRGNFGTIIGCLQGIMVFCGLAAPPFAGWVYDTWGSYGYVWLVFSGIALLGAVLLATIPPLQVSHGGGEAT